MNEIKIKTRDLYSFSDTDLLLQMSWKDDPTSVSVEAFDVFFERYKDHVWPIVYQVCKNYTPHHGKQLPDAVFNNTFVLVFESPLSKMDHLETFTDEKVLRQEVKLWMMQLAGEALRELMNGGEEDYRKHIVLKPIYTQSSTADADSHLMNEDNQPYNSDNLTDNQRKSVEAADEAEETTPLTSSETDDLHQEDAPVQGENMSFDDTADSCYNADAAFEEEAEAIEFTTEQREAARIALTQLTHEQKDILMTMLASEQRGRKRPPDVMKALETKYQTTPQNLRAIKSRALKHLRKALGGGTQLQI
ncbi:MAG: Sigma-70 region 2 [Bacteroidetes bacterium]|nr:MAG: Sigma-70 region 2 [Bacteroidota bacterium]